LAEGKGKKAQEVKKDKEVPELMLKPLSPALKKAIISPSYTWKFGLTKLREIRSIEVGSVFFDKDIKNLQVSPASAIYRDWEQEGLPLDRPPKSKEESK